MAYTPLINVENLHYSVTAQAMVENPGYVCESKCSEQGASAIILPECDGGQRKEGRETVASR